MPYGGKVRKREDKNKENVKYRVREDESWEEKGV
jgi:hypothetical protein